MTNHRDPDHPNEFVEDDPTKPVEIIERSIDRYERDRAYRSQMDAVRERYDDDPAFATLWNMVRRQRRESIAARNQVAAVAAPPSEDAAARLRAVEEHAHRIDSAARIVKWMIGICLAACLGSIVAIAAKVWSAGYADGEIEIRVQHLERDMARLIDAGRRSMYVPTAPSGAMKASNP